MEDTLNRPSQIGGVKLIVGIFFLIHGLLLTADNLGVLDAWHYLRYWPALVLLVGLMKLYQPGRALAGAIITLIGAALLAYSAGWVHLRLFDLWPLLLILGGGAMVARALGVRPITEAAENARNIYGIFNVQKVHVASQQFSGARVAALMGSCEIDLTDADIAQSPAVIEAFALWGGIEIFVPDDWEVIGDVVPIMAGFEIKTAPPAKPKRQLIVRGLVTMAGIEVKRRAA